MPTKWPSKRAILRRSFKHYRELATEAEADAWFGIQPKPDQWENTISYNRLTRTVTLPADMSQ